MILLHQGAFQLDCDRQKQTFWQRLAPQTRVFCAVLFVFATGLTPNGHWWTWGVYGLSLGVLGVLSQVTPNVLLQRLAVELIFISTVLVGTLFRDGGIVLWQWGWLSVTSEGLVILASVFLKASLSLAMLNLLVLTTAVPDLFQALVALRIPRLLVAILAAMYRYTEVLIAEFNTMKRAATARNLMTRSRWQRLVIGHMIGALFIRTYDRGVRIHQAMLARGYTGIPAIPDSSKVTKTDWVFVLFFLLVLLAGQLVYLFTASGLF